MPLELVDSTKDTPTSHPDPICEFYTEHPYPPPVENLDRVRDEWRDEQRRRAEYHLFWPHQQYRADLDILVAGCGTWQGAKYALCHPAARVTGIDVSTTSLEHTAKLKSKYNLTNLKTQQLAVEKTAELDQQFDLIVCTGVLHHLVDPDVGLSALRSVLKPGGAIYLMVYAPYGRAGVYLLQDYCRRLGIGTSVQEINDLATVVEALPEQHPLVVLLRGSRDALTADALADALLNPRDRSYSVQQLLAFVERNGLSFGRWYWQAPYLPQCGSIAATPHSQRLAALSLPEQYLALELLRGTMTTHSAIVYREEAHPEIDFGKPLSSYVPFHQPTTMCVMERLPQGAAGVLLNRSHQFHDLILPINAQQKRIFDAIDGHRTVAEIVDSVSSRGDSSPAHEFFQQLWRYDQIVFDTSSTDFTDYSLP
ncbi:MAG TPA: class I SAM-dependent methyltransferase [Pyrinomonadaceae bacterium]|nr:class I SAM-dependent methyltransferase [Pyrinomonadaceae bacterium]